MMEADFCPTGALVGSAPWIETWNTINQWSFYQLLRTFWLRSCANARSWKLKWNLLKLSSCLSHLFQLQLPHDFPVKALRCVGANPFVCVSFQQDIYRFLCRVWRCWSDWSSSSPASSLSTSSTTKRTSCFKPTPPFESRLARAWLRVKWRGLECCVVWRHRVADVISVLHWNLLFLFCNVICQIVLKCRPEKPAIHLHNALNQSGRSGTVIGGACQGVSNTFWRDCKKVVLNFRDPNIWWACGLQDNTLYWNINVKSAIDSSNFLAQNCMKLNTWNSIYSVEWEWQV